MSAGRVRLRHVGIPAHVCLHIPDAWHHRSFHTGAILTRIIIIDPFRLVIEGRQLEGDTEAAFLPQFHEIIGGYLTLACQIPVPGGSPDVCYVDDDGLYKYDRGFVLAGWGHQTYMGTGLITGSNYNGDTVSARVQMIEVRQRLGWALPLKPHNDH